jgi:hypothetical protein
MLKTLNLQERPAEDIAIKTIQSFLEEIFNATDIDFSLIEDGDFNWAFWINEQDTTSYLHQNLKIEWYGSSFNTEEEIIED